MGLNFIGSNDNSYKYNNINPLPNPNPNRFKIIKYLEKCNNYQKSNTYLLVLINYPDCKNYEGNKILLFSNLSIEELKRQDKIDPHFSEIQLSPIARFEPTLLGWKLGEKLIDILLLNINS